MSDGITMEMDAAEVLAAIDALGPSCAEKTKSAARITANAVAIEARGRVRRRKGETLAGIAVEDTYDGVGYVVLSANEREPNLPHWLDKGTSKMDAHPYFDASAVLEERPHFERISDAIQQAINEKGLGG